MNDDPTFGDVLKVVAMVIGMLLVLTLVVFAGIGAAKAFGRYQTLADEQNQVQVNDIKIAQTNQLVKVEQQKAAIRVADAQGIAQSQEIINGTLSSNYLQYLAIQAQIDMANKSDHSATVYIPTGQNGVPIVTTQPANGGR